MSGSHSHGSFSRYNPPRTGLWIVDTQMMYPWTKGTDANSCPWYQWELSICISCVRLRNNGSQLNFWNDWKDCFLNFKTSYQGDWLWFSCCPLAWNRFSADQMQIQHDGFFFKWLCNRRKNKQEQKTLRWMTETWEEEEEEDPVYRILSWCHS